MTVAVRASGRGASHLANYEPGCPEMLHKLTRALREGGCGGGYQQTEARRAFGAPAPRAMSSCGPSYNYRFNPGEYS